jgi:hypothetical protein
VKIFEINLFDGKKGSHAGMAGLNSATKPGYGSSGCGGGGNGGEAFGSRSSSNGSHGSGGVASLSRSFKKKQPSF